MHVQRCFKSQACPHINADFIQIMNSNPVTVPLFLHSCWVISPWRGDSGLTLKKHSTIEHNAKEISHLITAILTSIYLLLTYYYYQENRWHLTPQYRDSLYEDILPRRTFLTVFKLDLPYCLWVENNFINIYWSYFH